MSEKTPLQRLEESEPRKILGISADVAQVAAYLAPLFVGVVLVMWQVRDAPLWYAFVVAGQLVFAVVVFLVGWRYGRRREGRRLADEHRSALERSERRLEATLAHAQAKHASALARVLEYFILMGWLLDYFYEALEDPRRARDILHHMRGRLFAAIANSYAKDDIRIAFLFRRTDRNGQGYLQGRGGYVYGHSKNVKQRTFELSGDTVEAQAYLTGVAQHVPDIAKNPRANWIEEGEDAVTVLCAPATGLGVGDEAGPVGVLRVSSRTPSAFTDSDIIAIKLAAAALGAAEDYVNRSGQ